jgi:hypothetical protein
MMHSRHLRLGHGVELFVVARDHAADAAHPRRV